MHGIEFASHCSETGFTMSGVPEEISTSTSSLLMSSVATSAARVESLCASLTMISTS